EHIVLGRKIPRLTDYKLPEKERKRDLAPDALVPVTGLPADLAKQLPIDKYSPLNIANAIYEYVLDNVTYDKNAPGIGQGDAVHVATYKRGDCTDFHSLFIAMVRSRGIPARFEIGFSLPADKTAGEISAYGCWADFFDPQNGWVPVDISEASQHAE